MKKQKKLIGKIIIDKNRPILRLNWPQYIRLMNRALAAMDRARYKPDAVVYIMNGGWFGMIIAKAIKKTEVIWVARSYKDTKRGAGGRRRKQVRFFRILQYFDKNNQPIRLTRKNWPFKRILIVDDLDDTGRTLHKAEILLHRWFGEGIDIKALCLCHKSESSYTVHFVGQTVPSYVGNYRKPVWIDQPHEAETRVLCQTHKHRLQ